MWHFRLWDVQDVAVFLSITLCVCHLTAAISISSSQRNLIRSVQEDVFFSVNVTCSGVPTIRWTFMSGAESRSIGTWQPGAFTNISAGYGSRVTACDNGSLGLSDLRVQDSGFYVVSVQDPAGNNRDVGFVLKVNEVLYEDLQYLSVTALALMVVAGLLMLSVWLLHKACRKIQASRRRRQMPAEGLRGSAEMIGEQSASWRPADPADGSGRSSGSGRRNPEHTTPAIKHGGGSIMLW